MRAQPRRPPAHVPDAAQRLGVSLSVLLDWYRRGLLPGRQRKRGAPVWIRWDEALCYRVSGDAPRDLPTRSNGQPPLVLLRQAPIHFGVTTAELKTALRAGAYLTWRLEYGCQYRWYVQEKVTDSMEPAKN